MRDRIPSFTPAMASGKAALTPKSLPWPSASVCQSLVNCVASRSSIRSTVVGVALNKPAISTPISSYVSASDTTAFLFTWCRGVLAWSVRVAKA